MFVKTVPSDVQIIVNGKKMGEGNSEVVIPINSCITVEYVKEGYVNSKKNYCNEYGVQPPPVSEHFILKIDEAFTSSVQSDQANLNFTIEISLL